MKYNRSAHILRVFTDSDGGFGDTASVVIDDGKRISDVDRRAMARELDTGETIFVNNMDAADITVMHPQGEIDFAGVGVLATAWLLARLRGEPVKNMQSRSGKISVSQKRDITWVRAGISSLPPWHIERLGDAKSVERISVFKSKPMKHTIVWAWIDELKGVIRARTFAADWDIPEAEGNGSGSMKLASELGRDLEIRHGKGSVIFAKPAGKFRADLGGRITEDRPVEV